MKRVVWKYALTTHTSKIEVPLGSEFLHAAFDPTGQLCAWFLVDPEERSRNVTIRAVNTGYEFDDTGLHYMSTIQDGPIVWHLFRVTD